MYVLNLEPQYHKWTLIVHSLHYMEFTTQNGKDVTGKHTHLLPVALLLILRTPNNTRQRTRDTSLYHIVLMVILI